MAKMKLNNTVGGVVVNPRTTRRLGWKPQLPDHRDFLMAPPAPNLALPPGVDRLTAGIPIWDQGQLGSCTGFGVGALWAHREMVEHKQVVAPSQLFIYYNERLLEGSVASDSGASVRDGLRAISKWGVPTLSVWPYNIAKFAKKPTASVYTKAIKNIATQYSAIPQGTPANVALYIKASLAAGNPVVGGFTVYSSFMGQAVASTGDMPMPAPGEQVEGGHCVLWDGYDDATQTFWCRNSWGTGWGNKGWFRMPYANLVNCADFWNLTAIK